ncbi:MAG: GNAT family N-acetyltransferase [Haloarculaceae archaeon]
MVRLYREDDRESLWDLKRGFERALGSGTGGDAKQARYEAKLDAEYREGYLEWVERCVAEQPRAVQVAERGGGRGGDDDGEDDSTLAGYVFVLPESLTYIWDAAVVNELFVRDSYRGTGLADDLMEAALVVAREQDTPLERVVLDVDPDNERARAFYDRWGFEPWGEILARSL